MKGGQLPQAEITLSARQLRRLGVPMRSNGPSRQGRDLGRELLREYVFHSLR